MHPNCDFGWAPSSFDFANLPEVPAIVLKPKQAEPKQFFYFTYGKEAYIIRFGEGCGWSISYVEPALVNRVMAKDIGAKRVYLNGQPYDEELVVLYSKDPDFGLDRQGVRDLEERAFLNKYLPGLIAVTEG